MYKILFVTPGQPSLNPRLVKEADTLISAGFDVTVIYSYWNNWGREFNKILLREKKWDAICAGGDPVNDPQTYFMSRLIHKITKWLYYKLHFNFCAELAVARTSFFLIREAKKYKADIYIGHNLGALPAVVKAAKKYNAQCGFDAEDFHRQEVSDDRSSFNFKISEYLENKYLTKLDYFTTSSPQITEAYKQLYPNLKPTTVLNVFPKNNHLKQRSINKTGPVKIFWFSQTIGHGRGIEDVFNALQILKNKSFQLHLLGQVSSENKKELINKTITAGLPVFFYDPIPPNEIIEFASQFDIGLASEDRTPLNRDICLTNKIFTYLQAGLAIVASDTTSQRDFMEKHPEVGRLYQKADPQSLASILSIYQSRDVLFNTCEVSLKLGRETLNWENENICFLSNINKLLN